MSEANGSEQNGSGNPNAGNAGTQGTSGNQGTQGSGYTPSPMVIPEQFKGEKSLASFKTHDDFVKSHLELSKKLGTAVWLPGEKDDPASKAEKMNKLYGALGKPASADAYVLDKYKEGALSSEHLMQIQQFAFANNMNQAQFEAAANFVNDLHAGSVEALRAQDQRDIEFMQKEWGDAVFKHRSNLAFAAIKKLGGEELGKVFAERGLGNNPKLVELFAKIGADILEGNAFDAGEAPGAMSKEEAQKKINEVMANPNDLYHRKHAGKAGHKERVEEMASWYQIVHSR